MTAHATRQAATLAGFEEQEEHLKMDARGKKRVSQV